MFDIGLMEMMVVGLVALIVIGPKDLPEMFRQLGRITAKLKSMANEFTRAMEAAAKESGAADISKDINALANPRSAGVDALKSAADKFEKWDPVKNAARPSAPMASETIRGPVLPPNSIPPSPAPSSLAPSGAAPQVSAEPAPAPQPPGPNTAALYEKQAARKKILAESAEKLRALEAGPVQTGPVQPDASAEKPAKSPSEKPAAKPAAKRKSPVAKTAKAPSDETKP